ncbi:MAG: hypothetical protein AAFP78_11510 [Pseudomonadota bacterium]
MVDATLKDALALRELLNLETYFSEHPRRDEVLVALDRPSTHSGSVIPLEIFDNDGSEYMRLLVEEGKIVEVDVPSASGQIEIEKTIEVDAHLTGIKRHGRIRLEQARKLFAAKR